MTFLNRLMNVAGLDKAVSVTLITRSWAILAGLGTLFFVARYLTPEMQGYYYTFNSLIALQIFVELGLNYAIIQFASHEMANLKWGPNDTLTGDSLAKRRLQTLIRFAFAWFGVAALLILLIVLPAGMFFLGATASSGGQIHPEWAWVSVIIFTAITLLINAALAVLDGCNKVAEVATIRLSQAIVSTIVLWIALASEAGLYALAAASCAMVVVGGLGIYWRYQRFFIDLWKVNLDVPGIKWKEEIWPFQWRIAVSWASGYLIFQIYTPMLFAFHGSVAAGQMGMSLQIIGAMNGAAMVWVTTKTPLFGQLIAQNRRADLNDAFKRAALQSTLFLLGGVLTVLTMLLWAHANYPIYANRVVPPLSFGVISLVCLANHIVFCEAAYLRAHKEEPFMALSVTNGVLTLTLAGLLIPQFETSGAVAAYAIGGILIGLFGGTLVFIRKRKILDKSKSALI